MWQRAPVSYQEWNNFCFGNQGCPTFVKISVRPVYSSLRVIESLLHCSHSRITQSCHFEENQTAFSAALQDLSNSLQPSQNSNKRCVALLMVNLAEVQWISVACSEPLLSHVVCMSKTSSSVSLTPVSVMPVEKSCETNAILFNQTCFTFHWFGKKDQFSDIQIICKKESKSGCCPSLFPSETEHFVVSVLFTAINLDTLNFLLDNGKMMSYNSKNVWIGNSLDIMSSTWHGSQAFFACTSISANWVLVSLLFQCNDSTVMPKVFLYDGMVDCGGGRDRTDETFDFGFLWHMNSCIPLLHKSRQGLCQSYVQQNTEIGPKGGSNSKLLCLDGHVIGSSEQNDLVADCAEGEDEFQYKNLLDTGHMQGCKNLTTLPCVAGLSKCYQFSDICIYRLNSNRHLIPCRTGAHIQECMKFECNSHFKCAAYYCVPWAYTCDGKWDCPAGYDESASMCNIERNCSFMLKCKDSSLCLHTADHCDGYSDCPGNDDELLCFLYELHCPRGCVCLNLALACHKQDMLLLDSNVAHFASLYMVDCGIQEIKITENSGNIIAVNISRNRILLLPVFSLYMKHVRVLDASQNFLQYLQTNTFCSVSLHKIILNSNNISKIETNCFCDLWNVSLMDLSRNSLFSFHQNMLQNISKIYVLNLADNPLTSFKLSVFTDTAISIEILYTNDSRVCCLKPEESECFPSDSSSCSSALPSTGNQVTFLVVSVIIILVNLCALFATVFAMSDERKQLKQKQEKGSPYHSIACTIFCTHFVFCMYLLTMFVVSIHEHSTEFLVGRMWNESLWCTFTLSLLMFHLFAEPLLFMFLATARLQVIQHPFESRFKSGHFVMLCLIFLGAFCVLFTFVCSVFFRIEDTMLSKLCLPSGGRNQYDWVSKVVTTVVFSEQIMALVLTSTFYMLMSKCIMKSQASTGKSKSMKPFYCQVVVLIISHVLSWIPISVFFIISTFQFEPSETVGMHLVSFAKPIECFTTPILFLILLRKNR